MNLAESRSHVPLVNKPKAKNKRGKIRVVSKKMSAIKRQYMKMREVFLLNNPYCEWFWKEHNKPVPATQVHHKRGRGKFMLDVSTWMAVSDRGHKEIHDKTGYSYEMGYMLPRNK